MTHGRNEIQRLLDLAGTSPSKALGQNFVADPNLVRRIVREAELSEGDHTVEIGAGLGSLTLALAETGAHVVAIERDRHLIPVLSSVLEGSGVELVEGDAMQLDWDELLGERSWTLVANLPYNIATPLVLDRLRFQPSITRMLVMVQREVGERLAATPGTAGCGIPSVKVAHWASCRVVMKVGPDVFVPRPRVDSVVVDITRHDQPALDVDTDVLFGLVDAGFGQRRKMLRRALKGFIPDESVFDESGVSGELRAEALDLTSWGALAGAVQARS